MKKHIRLITVVFAFILVIAVVFGYLNKFENTIDVINLHSDEEYQYELLICEFPETNDTSIRVYGKVIDTNHPADIVDFKVLADVNITNFDILKYGNTIRLNGCLKAADTAPNDGNFNYRSYLMSKNTIGICTADEEQKVVIVERDNGISSIMYKLHSNVSFYVDKYFDGDNNGLIKAMLTGNRENISESARESYQKAGIYHIVAVSGLHAGIFISVFAYLISIFSFSSRKKSMITKLSAIAISILLLMFTGYGISVIRVILMAAITAVCFSLKREYNIITSIITAAFIVIVFAPYYLFSQSFQLSFASTLGLCIALDLRKKYKKNQKHEYIKDSVTISVGSSIATAPLSTYFFGMISLVGIVLNIIVIPIATTLLISSVIFFTLSALLPHEIMNILAIIPNILAEAINILAKAASSFNFSYINLNLQTLSSFAIIIFVLTTIYIVIKRRLYNLAVIFVLTSIFVYTSLATLTTNKMKITFMNCINGECTIVTTPSGKHIMFDCGSDSFAQPTETLFKSYLNHMGINKIDTLYISYFDSKHINAVNRLIADKYINCIVIPPKTFSKSEQIRLNREKIINTAKRYNATIRITNPNETIKTFDGITIKLLGENLRTGNESACAVYKLTYKHITTTLSSSLAPTGQKKFKNADKCTLLKIPGYGKMSVTIKDYIKNSNPEYAVITAYESEKPDNELLDYLKYKKINTYRTDINQTITFKTDGYSITEIHTRKDN